MGPQAMEEPEAAFDLTWCLLNYASGREVNPELAAEEWEAAVRIVRAAWPAPREEQWERYLPEEVRPLFARLVAEVEADRERSGA